MVGIFNGQDMNIKIFIFLIIPIASAVSLPRFSLFEKNGCTYIKDYKFLNSEEKSTFEKHFNFTLTTSTVRKLKVTCKSKDKESISTAFLLNDKIRTHYQTLLLWVTDHKIKGVEVLEFLEPIQYKAPTKWYSQIEGKDLSHLYEVDGLSGATLTRQSTLKLVKQALYFTPKKTYD